MNYLIGSKAKYIDRVRNTIRMDPFNVKRALDPDTWNIVRYMEGVAVQSDKGDMNYFSLVVCEDRLIFLPLAGANLGQVIFREFGNKGFMVMVPAHDILSVGLVRGEDEAGNFWESGLMNSRSVHIKLNVASLPDPDDPDDEIHTAQFHIFTYEANSRIMFHLSAMWINCYTRIKALIHVIKEESNVFTASVFYDQISDILFDPGFMIQDQIQALSFFASEAINDLTLKKLFFQVKNVMY